MELDDFVHGRIVIPDNIAKIIKTPHFQRLKQIKQLGLLYKTFPSANYTRYDHSIGTYHLTSKMLESLENKGNWIINLREDNLEYERYKMYREAVKIAALLHDIGHGPFSHVWEKIVFHYNHEEVGKNCIDDIFQDLNQKCLPEFRANQNYGIELIKALVLGDFETLNPPFPAQYRFLFEIVHNNQCELDIDKLDYLKRDNYFAQMMCNSFKDISNQFDCIFFEARVGVKGRHIEYRYEDYKKIYALFEARTRLHVHFYRIPRVVACDWLLKRIIESGNFEIDGIPIDKIHSRPIATFLKFVDEKILKIIEGHYLFPYLSYPFDRIEIVKNEKVDNIVEQELCVNAAGSDMPADNRFHFYGDAEFKGNIIRDTKPIRLIHRFRLVN